MYIIITWRYDWSSQLYIQLKKLWNLSLKKFRPEQDLNPWPLRCRCCALANENWSYEFFRLRFQTAMISHQIFPRISKHMILCSFVPYHYFVLHEVFIKVFPFLSQLYKPSYSFGKRSSGKVPANCTCISISLS